MRFTRLNLIGYIRTGGTDFSAEQQKLMLSEYCTGHAAKIIKYFEDTDCPSFGFESALASLGQADGIIAIDLQRFAKDTIEPMIELRPVLDRLMHSHKALITVLDGLETLTANGQETMQDLMHTWSDRQHVQLPGAAVAEALNAR
jgi:hypothetical protein